MKPAAFILAASLAVSLSTAALADDLNVDPQFAGTELVFRPKSSYHGFTLSIAGPNDFHAVVTTKGGIPAVDLRKFGAVEDGTYTYQLTAATDEKAESRSRLDDGRGPNAPAPLKGVATSGNFQVQGGAIIKPDARAPSRRDQQ